MNMQRIGGLAWPSLFVVLTGIYVYWASRGELVSSRPATSGEQATPGPIPGPGLYTAHSRMWEDPLGAAYRHRQQVKSDPAAPEAKLVEPAMQEHFRNRVDGAGMQQTLCLPVLVPGGPYAEDAETRMRMRYAVVTALAEAEYYLKFSRRMTYVVTNVQVDLLEEGKTREIVVPVKLYQPREVRPGDPQAGYNRPQLIVLWINEAELGKTPLLSTYRILQNIFAGVTRKQNLDVKIIGPSSSDTLEMIRREVDQIGRAVARVESGPAGASEMRLLDRASQTIEATKRVERYAAATSDVAARIEQTLDRWVPETLSQFVQPARGAAESSALVAANAAVDTSALQYLRAWTASDAAPLWSPETLGGNYATKLPIEILSPRATVAEIQINDEFCELYRVVGTDQQLADALTEELARRGAMDGDIVLVTELDTSYGRKISETFKKAIQQREGSWPHSLWTYRVLRGADGKLPGDVRDPPRASKPSASAEVMEPPEFVERPPEGRSQHDYLRRLGRHIESKHGHVAAIGVVGSDVYDKLLVIRALRPHFPGTLFFTTDLDAIYAHPNEIQHTRNLIVASHFGLTLNAGLQQQTAPFRDSYQTATFLATRLAVRKVPGEATAEDAPSSDAKAYDADPESTERVWDGICIDCMRNPRGDWLQPLVHVVGRKQIYQLKALTPPPQPGFEKDAVKKKTAAAVHPAASPADSGWHYGFVLAVSLLVGGLVWGIVNRDRVGPFFRRPEDGRPNAPPARGPEGGEGGGNAADGDEAGGKPELQVPANPVKPTGWRGWFKQLRFGVVGPVAFGALLLVLSLCWWFVDAPASLFAGYTTWPRSVLQSATGIIAVCALAYLLDGYRARHLDGRVRFEDPQDPIEDEDAETNQQEAASQGVQASQEGGDDEDHERVKNFGMILHHTHPADLLKVGILGVAVLTTGVLFVYEFDSVAVRISLFLSVLVIGGLWCWCRFWRIAADKSVAPDVHENWILGSSPLPIVYCAAVVVGLVTLLALGAETALERSHAGWHPVSIARGTMAQSIDWLTTAYALGAVGMLVATLLFNHVWCREVSRNAENIGTDARHRLWFISKLTSVNGRLVPWLMGLLLLLVLTYHPVISPTPMPMGMLALITLALVVFVVSSLLLRHHFQQRRQEALAEIDESPEPSPPARPERQPRALVTLQPVAVGGDRSELSGQLELAVVPAPGGGNGEDDPQPENAPAVTDTGTRRKEELEALSEGVFQPWNKSPVGWLVGGGALLALADWWVRWWIIGL